MPQRRTLTLTEPQRMDLIAHRDHDPWPYVREGCAALLQVADGQAAPAVARHGLVNPRHGLVNPRDPDTTLAGSNRLAAVTALR